MSDENSGAGEIENPVGANADPKKEIKIPSNGARNGKKKIQLGWHKKAKKELEEKEATLRAEFNLKTSNIKKGVAGKKSKRGGGVASNDWEIVIPRGNYHPFVVALYFSIHAIIGIIVMLMPSVVDLFGIMDINLTVLMFVIQAAHIIASIKAVGVDDLAGVSFFGRPVYKPRTGLYIVPLGILTLVKASRNYRDVRFPGPADKIHRVSEEIQATEGDTPPEGMVRPIFVLTGAPMFNDKELLAQKKGETDPFDRQMTIEISYSLRYCLSELYGGIFLIISKLSSETSTESVDKRILDLLHEQSVKDLKTILSTVTTAVINENFDLINKIFILMVSLQAVELGIDIDEKGCGIVDINLGHKTNAAQAKIARAQLERTADIIKADGTRQAEILKSKGTASIEYEILAAKACGYKEGRKELGEEDWRMVLAAETSKGVLEKAETIVLGTDGVREVLGLTQIIGDRFSRQSKRKEGDKTTVPTGKAA